MKDIFDLELSQMQRRLKILRLFTLTRIYIIKYVKQHALFSYICWPVKPWGCRTFDFKLSVRLPELSPSGTCVFPLVGCTGSRTSTFTVQMVQQAV